MAQFLLYDALGGLVFHLPFLALAGLVGWKASQYIVKGRKLDEKYTKPLAIVIAVVVFVVLKMSSFSE